MNKKQLESLKAQLSESLASIEYELVDVEYIRDKGENYLRIYIYQEDGITLDDCEKVSTFLDPLLDEWDPIAESYYLEVSSPDLSRPLVTERDFERNLGEMLELKFYGNVDGKKTVQGKLERFDENSVTLLVDGEEKKYEREKIATAKIAIIFEVDHE